MTETAKTELRWPESYGVPQTHCAEIWAGAYEVPYSPKTPPVILDLGANIGGFVRWAVERWPDCTIHAYEPHPTNFRLLEQTVARLNAAAGKALDIYCYQRAVGIDSGFGLLAQRGFNCGEWALVKEEEEGAIIVPVVSARMLPPAEIMKIDVEGAEIEILATLHERLREFSAIMLEVHSPFWVEPLKRRMDGFGFSLTGYNNPSHNRVELKFVKSNLL